MTENVWKRENSGTRSQLYTLEDDKSLIDVTFDPLTRWLCIANVDVKPQYRRQGLAKIMLLEAVNLAEGLDATLIYSAIISRECLEAMESVFEQDAIRIVNRGTYTLPGERERYDANAILRIDI